jgi:hypothetical protein
MVNGNEITLDVSSLTAGVYFAVIQTEKEILVKKFVKEWKSLALPSNSQMAEPLRIVSEKRSSPFGD